mmetsp:Transcript_21215/g.60386  ORF Transcript_21215/g.60386 Transcript_21215/m.60386 type:complete len:332 (-) Transcript_21215:264-1259(-)
MAQQQQQQGRRGVQQREAPRPLVRTRHFIDGARDILGDTGNATHYNGVVRLRRPVRNVVSVELVDYSLPTRLTSPFITDTGEPMTMRVALSRSSHPRTEFTFAMPSSALVGLESDEQEASSELPTLGLYSRLAAAMSFALKTEVDTNIASYSGWPASSDIRFRAFWPSSLANGTFTAPYFAAEATDKATDVTSRLDIEFLFGSYPSEMAAVLGFDDNVDTAASSEQRPVRSPNVFRSRYVDITVDGLPPELAPLARVYTTASTDFIRSGGVPAATRFVTRPIERLEQLRIRMRRRGGLPVNAADFSAWHLTLDVLSLGDDAPAWTGQVALV